MIDVTSRIKNLSISFEALSRIGGYGATQLFDEVSRLLEAEINKLKEEKTRQASTTETSTSNDDIPF